MSRRRYEEEEDDEWEDEDEDEGVIDENDLTQLPGVDTSLAKKLKREGYETLWDLSMADMEDLTKYVGLTRELAKKLILASDKLLGIIR
jgi:predicted RecB family nuclease